MGKRAASSSKVNRKQKRREEKAEVKEEDDEIEEVSMQVVLAKQVPVKDEGRTKRTKAKKRSGSKVPHLRKPKLPQFAFEWFRQKTKVVDGEERPEKPLPQLVMEWKNLTEEERGHYITLAEEDRLRFEREYEEWRQKKAAQGKAEPALQDLLEKRRATLQRYLARAEGLEAPRKPRAKRGQGAGSRKRNVRPPEGFPKRPVKSAYGLFCLEQRAGITAEAETPEAKEQPKEGEGAADPAEDAKVDRPGVSKLLALRKAWSKLSDEEKMDYVVRAAEDQERFRKELEVWRQDPANEEMANVDFVLEESKVSKPSRKFPRPRVQRSELIARPTRPETGNTEIMYDILTGTQILAAQERKAEQKAARARRAEELEAGAFSESLDRPDSRAVQDFEDAKNGHVDTSVDDLLGDLLAVEAEPADEGDNGDIFGNAFQANSGGGAFGFGSQQQVASGPQLCLDESGNIVLNQSSLSRNVVTETPLEEGMDSNVQEAVSQYSGAYKKTPRCVWTQSETDLFYEALSLYGSDLFLVQTFFRNKSAGQIKTKYNKEMKKNPKLVEEALTLKSKRLTKETFEKLHGKIDLSRHYKPPPEPQPGDEPEPEVPLPEEDDDLGDLGGMPPPEPEYCAEDESLTTNRLMALFD